MIKAFTHLTAAMAQQAREQKRIKPDETIEENETGRVNAIFPSGKLMPLHPSAWLWNIRRKASASGTSALPSSGGKAAGGGGSRRAAGGAACGDGGGRGPDPESLCPHVRFLLASAFLLVVY